MSVLIRGMEMPITCCYCPLMGYDPDREWFDIVAQTGAHICVLTGELIDNTKREEHCPLVPVPPHGDLIDRDKFRGTMFIGEQCLYSWDEIEDAIDYAPTIIPAEEGE